MQLLLFLIIAVVIGYYVGRFWRRKTSPPASRQIVDAEARDTASTE